MFVQSIFEKIRAHPARYLFCALILVVVAYGCRTWKRVQSDPKLSALPAKAGAEWIIHDSEIALGIRAPGNVICVFRTFVEVRDPSAAGELRLCVARRANVIINGKFAYQAPDQIDSWKREIVVNPKSCLRTGRNEVKVEVENTNAFPALWAVWDGLGLKTDSRWESTRDLITWTPVRSANQHSTPELSRRFPQPIDSLLSHAGILFAAFLTGIGASVWMEKRPHLAQASVARRIILVAWLGIAINNISRISPLVGFDASAHLDVIYYILQHHRLPLATDGWQMFQSPLYYLISAPLLALLSKIFSLEVSLQLLRVIPLLCGLAQIEIGYRAVRRIFPDRNELQILGTLIAAAIPVNLYMSHYVGNEPLSGVLIAAVFLACLRLVAPLAEEKNRVPIFALGVLFGLAMLAKVSALLMAPVILAALVYFAITRSASILDAVKLTSKMAAVVFGVATLIAGWYYLRNWIHLGRPFVSGWDFNRGFSWWQEPGFRVIGDYTRFGRALISPVYSCVHGFWDGLYATFWCDGFLGGIAGKDSAPPWNYGYFAASVLLALAPSAFMAVGLARFSVSAIRFESIVGALIALALCIQALSLVEYSLALPYFGALKGSYTLGAMPAFVLLAVAGLDLLGRAGIAWRAILCGVTTAWACSALATYFVIERA